MNRQVKNKLLIFTFILSALLFSASLSSASGAEQKTTITYTVKKGDTLWGLSQKFFDSPWYWPGLWAENTDIANPHWIYPGQEITLYSKNAISEIKEKKKKSTVKAVEQIKKDVKKEKEKKPLFAYQKINKLPFIAEEKIDYDGIIKKGVGSVDMYSTTDEVYIYAENKSAKFLIGEKYAVYKQPEKILDPHTKDLIGYQYNLAGVVEILKNKGNLLRAVITNTYRPINKGDLITEFNEISPDIFLKPSVKNLEGKIIKPINDGIYMGEQFTAFIDAGLEDKVERGQIYSVVEEQTIETDRKNKVKELIPFASFIVLDSRKTTSSVLIIEAEKQIKKGAKFISPGI
ncbi:MAG: LysM peptidoglycan-binding domain-containing protein [Thermodesulfobacteriota bacterium]